MSEPRRDLAGALAVLARRLPPAHVAAWARVLRDTPVLDSGVEARLIEAKSGFAIGGSAALLVDAWRAAGPRLPGPAVALALQTAALMHAECAAHRSDVVVSGPVSDSADVRLTSSVISEVIRECRDSLHGTHGASAAFESLREHATFWIWPAARRPAVGASRAALHAKLVAADERVAFLGSANLTDKALAYNLELGVIIRDPEVVRRIVSHFRSLMNPGSGPLERVATA
jgi:phosphatidylserine/phosphatidylglycerophosphate/cardiolipin synthase-like enzyme